MTREEAIKELERISEDTVQRDCSSCGRITAGSYLGVCCYCSLCQVVPEIFRDYHESKHFRSYWKWDGERKNEALDMAIAALREQEERNKGCEFCKGVKYIYGELSASGHVDADHDFVHEQYGDLPICPMCGRRLEETCSKD